MLKLERGRGLLAESVDLYTVREIRGMFSNDTIIQIYDRHNLVYTGTLYVIYVNPYLYRHVESISSKPEIVNGLIRSYVRLYLLREENDD